MGFNSGFKGLNYYVGLNDYFTGFKENRLQNYYFLSNIRHIFPNSLPEVIVDVLEL